MERYTSEQFHTYNPDADLDDSILKKSPVPRKLPGSATLEDIWKVSLKKKWNFNYIQQDKSYQKIQ